MSEQTPATTQATPTATEPGPSPLRSLHTESFPALLEHLGVSLLVTTYQAGKLVVLRCDNGVLNTHFRGFNVPMGLAVEGDRLALGNGAGDLGVPQRPRRGRQAGSPWEIRCLLSAARLAHHRQHPDPRDGVGKRSG